MKTTISDILKILLTVCTLITFNAHSQENIVHYDDPTSYSQIKELIELYLNGQHDIIGSKMVNNEYKLNKYTPDYSQGKKDYSGDYEFVKLVKGHINRPEGEENKWKFKTIKYSDLVTEYQVNFSILSTSSELTFMTLSEYYLGNDEYELYNPKNCSYDSCILIESLNKYYCLTEPDYTPEFELNPSWFSQWSMRTESTAPNSTEHIWYPAAQNEDIFKLNLKLTKPKNIYVKTYLFGELYVRKLHNRISNWEEFKIAYNSKSIVQQIPFKRVGNIYQVKVQIGGKPFDYIIDSGASDLVITSAIEKHLISIGALRDSDYLPPKTYTLADGSTKTFRRVNISTVVIGPSTIKNVTAIINSEQTAPLLLGKSFLDKMVYWKINNQNGFLEYKLK